MGISSVVQEPDRSSNSCLDWNQSSQPGVGVRSPLLPLCYDPSTAGEYNNYVLTHMALQLHIRLMDRIHREELRE